MATSTIVSPPCRDPHSAAIATPNTMITPSSPSTHCNQPLPRPSPPTHLSLSTDSNPAAPPATPLPHRTPSLSSYHPLLSLSLTHGITKPPNHHHQPLSTNLSPSLSSLSSLTTLSLSSPHQTTESSSPPYHAPNNAATPPNPLSAAPIISFITHHLPSPSRSSPLPLSRDITGHSTSSTPSRLHHVTHHHFSSLPPSQSPLLREQPAPPNPPSHSLSLSSLPSSTSPSHSLSLSSHNRSRYGWAVGPSRSSLLHSHCPSSCTPFVC